MKSPKHPSRQLLLACAIATLVMVTLWALNHRYYSAMTLLPDEAIEPMADALVDSHRQALAAQIGDEAAARLPWYDVSAQFSILDVAARKSGTSLMLRVHVDTNPQLAENIKDFLYYDASQSAEGVWQVVPIADAWKYWLL